MGENIALPHANLRRRSRVLRRLTTARSTGGGIVRLHIGTYLIVVSHIDRMFCVLHYPGTMTKGATAMSAMAWVAGGGRCRLPASFPDAADGAGAGDVGSLVL